MGTMIPRWDNKSAAPYIGQSVTYVLNANERIQYGLERAAGTVTGFPNADGNAANLSVLVNVPAAAQKSAKITGFSITSNVVTLNAVNSLKAGDTVSISGLTTGTYLNGQSLTVVSPTGTQFTAAFTHADVGQTADSGTAQQTQTNLFPLNVTNDANGAPGTWC